MDPILEQIQQTLAAHIRYAESHNISREDIRAAVEAVLNPVEKPKQQLSKPGYAVARPLPDKSRRYFATSSVQVQNPPHFIKQILGTPPLSQSESDKAEYEAGKGNVPLVLYFGDYLTDETFVYLFGAGFRNQQAISYDKAKSIINEIMPKG
jgi:hypothetical protein